MVVRPSRTGVENIHASTCEPGWNPLILILMRSPTFNRMLPPASSAAGLPLASAGAKVALTEPTDTEMALFWRVVWEVTAREPMVTEA